VSVSTGPVATSFLGRAGCSTTDDGRPPRPSVGAPSPSLTAAWRWLVLVVAATLLTTACEFNGAYDLPLPGGPVDAGDGFMVTAEFEDILNIVPKSPVMVDDVTVGEVTDVERVGWHAKITMLVRKDVVLPDNAIAEIRQVSLLGEKYVALEPPPEGASPDRLGDGDNIPLSSTGRNPEVEEVLGALSFLLSGGGVAQLGTITEELNKAMDGRQQNLRHLLASLTDVVGTLDDQKSDIIRAMQSVSNLTATLNAEKQTVSGALDVAGPAIKVLADQHDELIAMLTALDRLGVVGTRVIKASKDDLLNSLAHLRPVLSKLRATGDKLAPGLNLLISFPFPKEASEIVRGDYANTSIRADISLENILPPGEIPDIPIPDIPTPDIPPAGQVLSDVQKCLRSGDLTSQACQKVLADLDLLTSLKKKCKKDKYKQNPVCQVLNSVPDVPLDELGDVIGDIIGGILGRSSTTSASTRQPSSEPSMRALLGGGP
jgi:phospholipid/cholesterol/gamma-HCH transport system substrate-binding protein